MEFSDEFDIESSSTCDIIERQRKMGESPRLNDRVKGMALGAVLGDRLIDLSDRQIGQLLFDFCWPELYADSPDVIIVSQAIDRKSVV